VEPSVTINSHYPQSREGVRRYNLLLRTIRENLDAILSQTCDVMTPHAFSVLDDVGLHIYTVEWSSGGEPNVTIQLTTDDYTLGVPGLRVEPLVFEIYVCAHHKKYIQMFRDVVASLPPAVLY
jgi:hypothetical protein